MKIRDLAFLALRVLAIYVFIVALRHLANLTQFTVPSYLELIESGISFMEVFLLVFLPTLILITGGLVLWIFARPISKYLMPKSPTESENDGSVQTLKGREVEGFVIAAVGLVLVLLSFPAIVRLLVNYFNMVSQDIGFNRMTYITPIIEQGLRLILGIILLLKAEGFALILRKIRKLGFNS